MDDGIRENFDLYRKWFQTLLVKEFLNLPSKYQERFLVLVQKFIDDCKKIHEEGKKVKERPLKIIIEKVLTPDNKEEKYIVCGHAPDVEKEIRISYPKTERGSIPEIGAKLCHVVYSLDNSIWYSSKTELLKAQGNY